MPLSTPIYAKESVGLCINDVLLLFSGALGGSKDVMGVRWERLPSVYSQTFLLLKLLRAATKHFQIVQDDKKYESNYNF